MPKHTNKRHQPTAITVDGSSKIRATTIHSRGAKDKRRKSSTGLHSLLPASRLPPVAYNPSPSLLLNGEIIDEQFVDTNDESAEVVASSDALESHLDPNILPSSDFTTDDVWPSVDPPDTIIEETMPPPKAKRHRVSEIYLSHSHSIYLMAIPAIGI
jgi:hypothetical protein